MIVCEERGRHGIATLIYQCEKVYQLTCPDCAASQLVTDDEIFDGIREFLRNQGYTNIERI